MIVFTWLLFLDLVLLVFLLVFEVFFFDVVLVVSHYNHPYHQKMKDYSVINKILNMSRNIEFYVNNINRAILKKLKTQTTNNKQ